MSHDFVLENGGRVLHKVTRDDTFVKIRLMRPYRFKNSEEVKPAFWEGVANKALANRLANQGVAAILYEDPNPKIVIARR